MATVATLDVLLRLDAAEFSRAIGDVGKKMSEVGKEMQELGGKLTRGLTAPLVGVGAAAFKMAADSAEAASKMEAVFGPATDSMNQWLSDLRTTVPATTMELQGMASGIQDLLVPLGMVPGQAQLMTKEVVKLAADLASFNNIPIGEALARIRSGMVGQYEPVLNFGVALSAASVQAKALEMGLISQGEELDANARAQAAFQAILEGTTAAHGDAAKTAWSAANSLKFMWAETKEAASVLGGQLLPILTPVIQRITEMVRGFRELSPETQKNVLVVGALAAAIGPVILVAGKMVSAIGAIATATGVVVGWLGSLSAAFAAAGGAAGVAGAALGVLTGPIGLVVAGVTGLTLAWVKWGDDIRGVMDAVMARVGPALEAISERWTWMKASVGEAVDAVIALVLTFTDVVVEGAMAVARAVKDVLVGSFMFMTAPIRKALQLAVDLTTGFARGVDDSIGTLVRSLSGWLVTTWGRVMDGFVNILRKGVGLVDRLIPGFADRFEERFEQLRFSVVDTTELMSDAVIRDVELMGADLEEETGRTATAVVRNFNGMADGVADATRRAASMGEANARALAESLDRETLAGVNQVGVNMGQLEPLVATGGGAAVREARARMQELEAEMAERSASGVALAGEAFAGLAGRLAGPLGLETDQVRKIMDALGVDLPAGVAKIAESLGPEWGRVIDAISNPVERLPDVLQNWRSYWKDLAEMVVDFWDITKKVLDKVTAFFKSSNGGGLNLGGSGDRPAGTGTQIVWPTVPGGGPNDGFVVSVTDAVLTLHPPLRTLIDLTMGAWETAGLTLAGVSHLVIGQEMAYVAMGQSIDLQRAQLAVLEKIERNTASSPPQSSAMATVSSSAGVAGGFSADQVDQTLGERARTRERQVGRVRF